MAEVEGAPQGKPTWRRRCGACRDSRRLGGGCGALRCICLLGGRGGLLRNYGAGKRSSVVQSNISISCRHTSSQTFPLQKQPTRQIAVPKQPGLRPDAAGDSQEKHTWGGLRCGVCWASGQKGGRSRLRGFCWCGASGGLCCRHIARQWPYPFIPLGRDAVHHARSIACTTTREDVPSQSQHHSSRTPTLMLNGKHKTSCVVKLPTLKHSTTCTGCMRGPITVNCLTVKHMSLRGILGPQPRSVLSTSRRHGTSK